MHDQILTLSNGSKLGYAEYGDPEGTPMLYFHGWPSSRLQGELMDDVGRRRHLRVIAPDRPGIGLSSFAAKRTLLDWPPVMAELTEHLGWKQFHVLGVSGGGPYVLAMAHAMPGRLLSAGVICGAPPLREVGTRELMWTYRLALWTQQRVPWMLSPGLIVAERLIALPKDSPPMRAYLRKLCERDRMAMGDDNLYRILTQSGRVGLQSGARALSTDGNIYSSDWGIDLGSVAYPIRYWHGGQDQNIPPALVDRFVRKMPNASLTVLDDDGHYSLPLLHNAEVVQALLGTE